VTGPLLFESGKMTDRLSYCRQASLPLAARGYLKSEFRTVPALPVQPGYYEVWDAVDDSAKPTCEEACGYMLLTARGIAEATTGKYVEPKGKIDRQAWNFVRITQDAPLHYFAKGKEDWQYFYVTMEEGGGFTLLGMGADSTRYVRRVDPARIPVNMMPRF
jgi:hypothetical protein